MHKDTETLLKTLTQSEVVVLILLAQGKSAKEIANLLEISVKTADAHRSNLAPKLGIHKAQHYTLFAIRAELLELYNYVVFDSVNSVDSIHCRNLEKIERDGKPDSIKAGKEVVKKLETDINQAARHR